MPALRLALMLALMSIGARPASAQWQDLDGLRVSVESPWPETLGRGYVPLFVSFENDSGDDAVVELEARLEGWANPQQVTARRVALKQGERREVELIVPLFVTHSGSWGSNYSVEVRLGRRTERLGVGIGSAGWEPQLASFVLFTASPWESSLPGELEQALKVGDLSSRGGSTPVPDVGAGLARFDRMPSDPAGYTSLDAVLVDTRAGFPDPGRLGPLLAWARLGGRVVFVGELDQLEQRLQGLPAMEGAFDERFRLRTQETMRDLARWSETSDDELQIVDTPRLTRAGAAAYRHGFGTLYLAPGFESDAERDVLRAALRPASRHAVLGELVPLPGLRGPGFLRPGIAIPGVDRLPLRSFMAMLLLFALVIGPANLILLRRFKRPALLLLTVPSLSLIASLGIVAYGILGQGVDVKTAAYSLTHLDQANHRAATYELRQMFAGLSPGRGLVPRAGTSVYPTEPGERHKLYEIESGGERVLSGAFLPVRTPVDQVYLTEEASRLRLDFDLAGEVVSVTNTLPVRVDGVLLHAGEGDWFARFAWIEPGEKVPLERVDAQRIEAFAVAESNPLLEGRTVPAGGYLALLAANPFRDDCGVEHNEVDGRHAVLGTLAAEELR